MSAELSDWLLDGIDPSTLEDNDTVTPLQTDIDTYYDYQAYNDLYYNYSVYSRYVEYYNYYNYYDYYNYYNYYNYSDSISLTLQPISQSVVLNETVTFVVRASNTIDSCQWYVADAVTGDGTVIDGATSPTLTLVASMSLDNKYYYCIVRRGGNTSISTRALLTVRSLTIYNLYVSVGSSCQMMFVRANPPSTQISSVSVADSSIATVTPSGEVTGISYGSTTVTVTGSNNVTADFTITVIEDELVAVLTNTAIALREYLGTSRAIYPNQMANLLRGTNSSSPYATIEAMFTDIADAIRSIDGTSSLIAPCDFYSRILSLIA